MAGASLVARGVDAARRGVHHALDVLRRAAPEPWVERRRGTMLGRVLGAPGPGPGQPTFSIVIPIYESPLDHLRCQLESIRTQTYPHFECILVDDGSPSPGAALLADEFSARDPRFRVIRRPANGGIAAATNDGLDAARNDFIVFSDHDDQLEPSALAAIATHLIEHPDDDVVYTDECLVDEDGELLYVYRKPDFSHHRFIAMNYFCHIVTMRRSLVERIGRLDPAMEPSADRDFNLRAVEQARGVGHIPDILYRWRAIDGSVAKDLEEKAGVKESTLAGAAAHLDRTAADASAMPAPHHPYLIRVERPTPVGTAETIAWDATTGFDELDRAVRSSDADRIVLHHRSIDPADWVDPLAALVAEPDVGAAAPRLATEDGSLVSGGHIHHPAVMEIAPGAGPADPGPWGVYAVDHEVASVEPDAVVFDRGALIAAGGFDLDRLAPDLDDDHAAAVRQELAGEFGMELLLALVCTRLWQLGTPAVWSPLSSLVVADDRLDWSRSLRRRAASRRLGRVLPDLLTDPYSPIEMRR